MRLTLIAVLALVTAACQTTTPTAASASAQYSGGDGTTKESAIVINDKDEFTGVAAEYSWIKANLPGAKIEDQSLVSGGRTYDVFSVTLPSGQKRVVYFDISAFFGKGL